MWMRPCPQSHLQTKHVQTSVRFIPLFCTPGWGRQMNLNAPCLMFLSLSQAGNPSRNYVCMICMMNTTKSIALSNPPQCPSAKRGLAAPVNHSERLWIWDWTDCIIIWSRTRTRRHVHTYTYVDSHRVFLIFVCSIVCKRVKAPLRLCKYSG